MATTEKSGGIAILAFLSAGAATVATVVENDATGQHAAVFLYSCVKGSFENQQMQPEILLLKVPR